MNNKSAKDQREFSRVDLKLLAKVKAKGEETVFTGMHNVSMKGLFVMGQTDWSIGTECEIHLILDGQNPPVDIKVKGRVQRITKEGIALVFTEVSLEAYEHLHNLVLLNTDDTEKVEQEFKSHLGLKKK
jgi:Tfp pilus assembly protein PilZ